jgi:hypothetical protein
VNIVQLLAVADGTVVAGFGGFAVVMLILALALSVFWLWMLIDCLSSNLPSSEKLLWALLIFFTHILGAILYYVMVRGGKRTGMV